MSSEYDDLMLLAERRELEVALARVTKERDVLRDRVDQLEASEANTSEHCARLAKLLRRLVDAGHWNSTLIELAQRALNGDPPALSENPTADFEEPSAAERAKMYTVGDALGFPPDNFIFTESLTVHTVSFRDAKQVNKILIFREPIVVKLAREHGMLTGHVAELDLHVSGADLRSVQQDLFDQIAFLWDEYACRPDRVLNRDATKLKRTLLGMVEPGYSDT